MLSFLLKQISIGIDVFLFNFFATFILILGLQATVGLKVNTGLQPPSPTHMELFVADTTLRRPEATKERV